MCGPAAPETKHVGSPEASRVMSGRVALGESGRRARLRLSAATQPGWGDALGPARNALNDQRELGPPGDLLTERRAEEPTQAAVGGVDARARRGRMRLDVHRGHTAPGFELCVRPGRGPRYHQLQAGDQEQGRPGSQRMPNGRLYPDAPGGPHGRDRTRAIDAMRVRRKTELRQVSRRSARLLWGMAV